MAMASCSSFSALDLSTASGHSLLPARPVEHSFAPAQLSCVIQNPKKVKSLSYRCKSTVWSSYRDGGGPSGASIFVGGFVLGGIIVGALGCIYAPQINKALAGADKKDLMRKLPKFIYDEEKALEKTRKVLTDKIAQLNAAIDEVSSQLRADDKTNGSAAASDEVEAAT